MLFNGMDKTSHWAALYFVALMTFGNYVLFNLLVAILVEGFSSEVGGGAEGIFGWLKRQLTVAQFDGSNKMLVSIFRSATSGGNASSGSLPSTPPSTRPSCRSCRSSWTRWRHRAPARRPRPRAVCTRDPRCVTAGGAPRSSVFAEPGTENSGR